MDVAGSFLCDALDGVGCFAGLGESRCSFSPTYRAEIRFIPHDRLQREQDMSFSFV
jgi:hypothetical protein